MLNPTGLQLFPRLITLAVTARNTYTLLRFAHLVMRNTSTYIHQSSIKGHQFKDFERNFRFEN